MMQSSPVLSPDFSLASVRPCPHTLKVNKVLVENYAFKFVLLLTGLHFLVGFGFLHFASSGSFALFKRAEGVASRTIYKLALAGASSIALLNYSLRFNSVGTYQIMKVAILPAVMALSAAQRISTPLPKEVGAAALVVVGTLVCTASDVWMTLLGLLVGLAGVSATAQYQIWQGSVQKENSISSTQALHLMSLPQAYMCFAASLVAEVDWRQRLFGGPNGESEAAEDPLPLQDDIFRHSYSAMEAGLILLTCVFAAALNYSTIGVIGKTSAVTMQFVAQVKTVLTIGMGVILFPKPTQPEKMVGMVAGLTLVICGVMWYTRLKSSTPTSAKPPAQVPAVPADEPGEDAPLKAVTEDV